VFPDRFQRFLLLLGRTPGRLLKLYLQLRLLQHLGLMVLLMMSCLNRNHNLSSHFVSMRQGLNIFLWGSHNIRYRNRRYSSWSYSQHYIIETWLKGEACH
jgi:hypothetical protein